MGGETENIKVMAEEVSNKIFSRFGWKKTGPTNENFTCQQPDKHNKNKNPSHPVDVVFQYDDPYTIQRHYLLTDLKSYSKGSIQAGSIKDAIKELSKAIDCANISQEWQQRYVNEELQWSVYGLLFVYNHDGGFDTHFNKFLSGINSSSLFIPMNSKIFVFGPENISYLLNILNDIDVERGKGNLPLCHGTNKIDLWYPDFINKISAKKIGHMAPVELLMGPWQVIQFQTIIDNKLSRGVYIYYNGKGESPKEFEFLIDFSFKNQLVENDCIISIRMPNAIGVARQNFEQAIDNIYRHFHSFSEVKNRLEQFRFTYIETVITKFSTIEIGMEARNGKIL